ncbi:MAG: hypothetical protein GF355_17430 [Candidatus Eisenbacteria bacterium]|nr:hypothetical protein [Candidatus Eisenbacteria bacterium]
MRRMLEPARSLLAGPDLWRESRHGFALFLSEDHFKLLHLPLKVEAQVYVDDRFRIKPLLPLLARDLLYYVLSLDEDHVKLWEGTRRDLIEVSLVSATPVDHLSRADRDRSQNDEASRRGGETLPDGVAHDARNAAPSRSRARGRVSAFFKLIDGTLGDVLDGDIHPLVLSGEAALVETYRRHSSYAFLVEVAVAAGFDPQALHRETWRIVEPLLKSGRLKALKRFRAERPRKTSTDLSAIVGAAYNKTVDVLFIDGDRREQWGLYRCGEERADLREAGRDGDIDLVEYAAVQTLLNEGAVYTLPSSEMPAPAPAAAILRD